MHVLFFDSPDSLTDTQQMSSLIQDVSDTAVWVAHYRAKESQRTDALFHDPLASLLTGERGKMIASQMKGSRYTEWSVVIRTCIIDQYLLNLVAQGVDTVVNLGSGLDTSEKLGRPIPMPFWVRPFQHFVPKKTRESFRKMVGYVLLEPKVLEG